MDIDKHGVPQFDELIIPVIEALKQLGGSGSNKEIDEQIIKILNIPQEIASIPHNNIENRTAIEYRAAWARTYLKKAGYIDNPVRSYWVINDGVDLDNINPKKIVDLVRLKAAEMTDNLQKKEITKIEVEQIFDKYVVQTLRDYLRSQSKCFSITDKSDLYVIDGIGEIAEPVYIEIKYGVSPNLDGRILEFCERAQSWLDKKREHILFIVSGKIPKRESLIAEIKSKYEIDISIWDVFELTEKIPTFPVNLDYLSNPRATIVEEVFQENDELLIKANEEKIKKLCDAYKNEKLVLFLGAGVSIDAGIPLWKDLINGLLFRMINLKLEDDNASVNMKELKKFRFSREDIERINTIALNNKEETPLLQMRYIKAALKEDVYFDVVHDELYRNVININTDLLNILAKISTPKRLHKGLVSVVTYNFDDLLEQNLKQKEVEYNVIQSDAKRPVTDKLNIYHVHGYIPQKEEKLEERTELIFSEEDYHHVYRDAYCWSNMAQVKSLQDNVCLFVGCSFNDPNLRRLLDNAIKHPDEARHFAILKRKKFNIGDNVSDTDVVKWYQEFDDKIRNQIFKSFGINVIWVNDYSEIPVVLNRLLEANES